MNLKDHYLNENMKSNGIKNKLGEKIMTRFFQLRQKMVLLKRNQKIEESV